MRLEATSNRSCATLALVFLGAALMGAPARAQDVAERTCGPEVRVGPGDTLSSLARRCGTDLAALLAANSQIENPDLVVVGTTLRLPTGAVATADAAAPTGSAVRPASDILVESIGTSRGSRLRVTGAGLPPQSWVWIKGGWSESGQILVGRAWTDRNGKLQADVPRPRWLGAGPSPESYKIVVEVPSVGRAFLAETAPPPVPTADVSGPDKPTGAPVTVRGTGAG